MPAAGNSPCVFRGEILHFTRPNFHRTLTNSLSSASQHSVALAASGLACVRGRRGLFSGVEFALDGGAALRIRGANGAGKTSLLRLLCGLSLPESGAVFWRGAPISACRAAYHRALVYLGHSDALNGDLTAPENLKVARALRGVGADADTGEALRRLGLGDYLHLPCGALSAGQRRRVALAGVALRRGGIWILDEPATALDDAGVALLEAMLSRANRRRRYGGFYQPPRIDIARRASARN